MGKVKEESNEISNKKSKRKKIITIIIILIVFLVVGGLVLYKVSTNKEEKITIQSNERDYTKRQVEVITEYINIREEDDVNSDILGEVYLGEVYTILSEFIESDFHWIKIKTNTGIVGYISGVEEYVKYYEVNHDNDDTSNEEEPIVDNENELDNNSKEETNIDTPSIPVVNTPTNTTTSTDKKEETTKKEDTNKKENTSKKTVEATKTVYCDKGYEVSNKENPNQEGVYCYKYEYEDIELYCSAAYTLNEEEKICEKGEKSRPNVDPINYPHCTDGGTLMYTGGTYYCRGGQFKAQKCPSGYEMYYVDVNDVRFYKCVFISTYVSYDASRICPGTYKVNESLWKCEHMSTKDINYKYTCPSGYTLKGTMCYK